ncbi:hypothetical protein FRB98_002883 [Tulasnella sp. 332]|nr:hypothetical protein FRB98_002883 [Tulasnella sp. 332]
MATMYSQQPANVVYVPQQPSQNQGTLTPGQTITLKQHTVTVERYLSQGGFAHVYLVRTPQPVNGTTQHVLKRMAVSDDIMLQEVKKEVDVMKVLRGHPNIVNLIDAASFAQPNGTHEVFILMEYCAGGGIIDMMNRRLRERLTESEILQIFVDVCEGVACMHNLKPALLHRDLKVENILQAGEKSFKLCDFGSAATAATKPPSTTAELKALENDLNRHTTLQYRAPEMVDPYLRRPVDEKSDVWALGVLLYKLCYYTTPFEEHGPLAILHVNYKIPAYPVYSSNMTTLITSPSATQPGYTNASARIQPAAYGSANSNVLIRKTDVQASSRSIESQPSYQQQQAYGGARQQQQQQQQQQQPYAQQTSAAFAPVARTTAGSVVRPPNTDNSGVNGATTAAAARKHVLDAIQPLRRGPSNPAIINTNPNASSIGIHIASPISPGGSGSFTFNHARQRPVSEAAAAAAQGAGAGNDEYDSATDPSPTTTPRDVAGFATQQQASRSPSSARRAADILPSTAPSATAQRVPAISSYDAANRTREGEQRRILADAKWNDDAWKQRETVSGAPGQRRGGTWRSEKGASTSETGSARKGADDAIPASDVWPTSSYGGSTAVKDEKPMGFGGLGGGRKMTGGGGVGGAADGRAQAFDGFSDTFDFEPGGGGGAGTGLVPPSLMPLSASAPSSSSQLIDIGSSTTTSTNPTGNKLPLKTGPARGPIDAFEGLGSFSGYGGGTPGTNDGGRVTPKRMTTGGPISTMVTPPLHMRSGTTTATPAGDYLSYNESPRSRQTFTGPGRSPVPALSASDISVEERFPSIEEYERRSPAPVASLLSAPSSKLMMQHNSSSPGPLPHRPSLTPQPSTTTVPKSPGGLGVSSYNMGARSQQTTGTAMKAAEAERGALNRAGSGFLGSNGGSGGTAGGPSILARRKSLLNLGVGVSDGSPAKKAEAPSLPPRPSVGGASANLGSKAPPPKDWLTGDDHSLSPPSPRVASASPSPAYAGAIQRRTSLGARRSSTYVPSSYTGRSNNASSNASVTPKVRTPGAHPATLPTVGRKTPANDSSDDEAEAPEDPVLAVSSSNAPRLSGAITGRSGASVGGVIAKTPTGPSGRASTHRKVGSVYDLVDVGSGENGKDTTGVSDNRHGRQSSVHDLVDAKPTPSPQPQPQSRQSTGRVRAPSPISDDSRVKSESGSRIAFPSSRTESPLPASPRGAQNASQSLSVNTQRPRPQSMFISPTSSYLNVPNKDASPIREASSPSPPVPESPRRVRPPRRGSISDIVSRYESLKNGTSPTAPTAPVIATRAGPPPPIKPVALYARTTGSTMTTSIGREKKTSLGAPPRSPSTTTPTSGWHSRVGTSPTVGRKPTIPPSSIDTRSAQQSATTTSTTLRMPTPTRGPMKPQTPTTQRTRAFTPPPPPVAEVRRSVSPEKEKPYQGVASLINQWQKKTETGDAGPAKRIWK